MRRLGKLSFPYPYMGQNTKGNQDTEANIKRCNKDKSSYCNCDCERVPRYNWHPAGRRHAAKRGNREEIGVARRAEGRAPIAILWRCCCATTLNERWCSNAIWSLIHCCGYLLPAGSCLEEKRGTSGCNRWDWTSISLDRGRLCRSFSWAEHRSSPPSGKEVNG
jgi:hypothetical protein